MVGCICLRSRTIRDELRQPSVPADQAGVGECGVPRGNYVDLLDGAPLNQRAQRRRNASNAQAIIAGVLSVTQDASGDASRPVCERGCLQGQCQCVGTESWVSAHGGPTVVFDAADGECIGDRCQVERCNEHSHTFAERRDALRSQTCVHCGAYARFSHLPDCPRSEGVRFPGELRRAATDIRDTALPARARTRRLASGAQALIGSFGPPAPAVRARRRGPQVATRRLPAGLSPVPTIARVRSGFLPATAAVLRGGTCVVPPGPEAATGAGEVVTGFLPEGPGTLLPDVPITAQHFPAEHYAQESVADLRTSIIARVHTIANPLFLQHLARITHVRVFLEQRYGTGELWRHGRPEAPEFAQFSHPDFAGY